MRRTFKLDIASVVLGSLCSCAGRLYRRPASILPPSLPSDSARGLTSEVTSLDGVSRAAIFEFKRSVGRKWLSESALEQPRGRSTMPRISNVESYAPDNANRHHPRRITMAKSLTMKTVPQTNPNSPINCGIFSLNGKNPRVACGQAALSRGRRMRTSRRPACLSSGSSASRRVRAGPVGA